jgi:hypothetical protein
LTGRFTIEQVAIAASSDVIKMYHVAENASELRGKRFDVTAFRGITSLDRNHLVKHLPAEYDCIVQETSVESVAVKELLSRNQIKQIDLLHIDAEGYDWIILQQFDFNLIRPRIVLFERKHLNKKYQDAARSLMQNTGYQVKPMETDFFCLKMTVSVVIASKTRLAEVRRSCGLIGQLNRRRCSSRIDGSTANVVEPVKAEPQTRVFVSQGWQRGWHDGVLPNQKLGTKSRGA